MKLFSKVILYLSLLGSSAQAQSGDPVPVVGLELDRYVGEWYEIASIPNGDSPFDCRNTKAIYEPLRDGTVGVENVCDTGVLGQSFKQRIYGIAAPLSTEEAIFSLTLRPLSAVIPGGNKYTRGFAVKGDYWVLELGADYEYALIGNPSRNSLFVLARSSEMDEDLYIELLELAETRHGYGELVEKMVLTPQDQ